MLEPWLTSCYHITQQFIWFSMFHSLRNLMEPNQLLLIFHLMTFSFRFHNPFLQRRWTDGAHPVEQGLVKWSHMPPLLATWEPLKTLRQQFSRALVRGHAVSQGMGNVSTAAIPRLTASPRQGSAGGNGPGEEDRGPKGFRSLTRRCPAQHGLVG